MNKLVEDIKIGETLLKDGKKLKVIGNYEVNGEGIGFIVIDENKEESKFSKSCGTYLTILS